MRLPLLQLAMEHLERVYHAVVEDKDTAHKQFAQFGESSDESLEDRGIAFSKTRQS